MGTLEERVRKLEDRAELHDLIATYFRATDDDDYGSLGDCFTSDATFAASGFSEAVGRADVTELLKAARTGMGQTVHTPNYVQLTFEGLDEASGMVAAHLELGMVEATYFGAVRYLDRYRREVGKWRIAHREMRAIHIGPWSDVESSLSDQHNVRWPGTEPQASEFPRHYSSHGTVETDLARAHSAKSNN